MYELKPCPFCGGKADLNFYDNWWHVRCLDNDCSGFIGVLDDDCSVTRYGSAELAAEKWNTRYEDSRSN